MSLSNHLCFSFHFSPLGGNASESFEDVGHSQDARELMKDYLIGELDEVSVYSAKIILRWSFH